MQITARSSHNGRCETVDGSSALFIRDGNGGAHLIGALLGPVAISLGARGLARGGPLRPAPCPH
eukprot:2105041-Pyramimonas_sp.AAC.1